MPDIEDLMQEWPPEMEAFLRNMKMPSGELVSGRRWWRRLGWLGRLGGEKLGRVAEYMCLRIHV